MSRPTIDAPVDIAATIYDDGSQVAMPL